MDLAKLQQAAALLSDIGTRDVDLNADDESYRSLSALSGATLKTHVYAKRFGYEKARAIDVAEAVVSGVRFVATSTMRDATSEESEHAERDVASSCTITRAA